MTGIPLRRRRTALQSALGVLLASGLALSVTTGGTPSAHRAERVDVVPAAATSAAAAAATGNGQLPLPWGHDTSKHDESYGAYLKASGSTKTLLGKIALRPRVRWFGSWNKNADIAKTIRSYVATTQNGDQDALVQLAIFRLWPRGGEGGKNNPLTAADQESYKQWVRYLAHALGTTRTAIVLEPDLGVALGGWSPATRLALTKYAAQYLSTYKNISVYIDGTDADWLSVDRSVAMLKQAGVAYVRGFALGATHYQTVAANTMYAAKVIQALKNDGIRDKHAILDTADNGQGFTWSQYWSEHPKGDFDNAETCTSTSDRTCVTLGVPPTPDVPATEGTAADNLDGYVWFGRAWLYRQASPWRQDRALAMAKTTPFAGP